MKISDIFLPRVPDDANCKIATHSRVGRDLKSSFFWDDEEDEDEEDRTYFLPKIDEKSIHYANLSDMSGLENCRQWFVIAQAHGNTIQLFSLPLGWKESKQGLGPEEYDVENDLSDIENIPFYLTSKLVLPAGGKVLDIGFYGDDGKSSLSSGIDSGTGVEGRQKIGFLYQTNSGEQNTTDIWTTSYDSLSWQAVPFDPMLLSCSRVDSNCTKEVLPVWSSESPEEEDGYLLARCTYEYGAFISLLSSWAAATNLLTFSYCLLLYRSNRIGRELF